MPRIAVKHPSGLHLIYSTVVDDFLCGAYTTEDLAAAFLEMHGKGVPICTESFLEPLVRDDPKRWEFVWSLSVDINGLEHTTSRVDEMLARAKQETTP